jgi:hypothetical protein
MMIQQSTSYENGAITSMTIIGMLLRQVDPFAVYAAERELAQHGRKVERELLVSQYLVLGQLRTLVRKIIETGDETQIDTAVGAAIMEGPDESKNPRFVAPLKTGLLHSAIVLTFIPLHVLIGFIQLGRPIQFMNWKWLAVIEIVLIPLCFVHAFLGARIGRNKANRIAGGLLGLGVIVFVYWITQYRGKR